MRLLKWIFHPVYLLLIIIAVVIYLNRSELFTDTIHSGDVNNVVEKVDSLIDTMQSESQISGFDDNDNVQSSANGGLDDISTLNTANKQNASRAETETTVVKSTATASSVKGIGPSGDTGNNSKAESVGTTIRAGADKPDSNEPDVTDESHDDTVAADPTVDSVAGDSDAMKAEVHNGASRSFPAVSREQLLRTWQQARIAAWYGDFDRAIECYQTVIALQPDNYDAYGEMGNVMLRAGDRDGAVEAYYQAALLLNKTPYRPVAWHLLNAIARLSPFRAEKLYQELIHP